MPLPKDLQLRLVRSTQDVVDLLSWANNRRDWLGLDTETSGLDWYREDLRLVQIGDETAGWAVPFHDWGGVIKEIIPSYSGNIVMHNSKFDLHFLEHNGVEVPRSYVHDTFPMVSLIEPGKPAGLKRAAVRHVDPYANSGEVALKDAMRKSGWDWGTVPIDFEPYWVYSALDPVLTASMAAKLHPQLGAQKRAYETEVAVAQVLCDMERRGMRLDVDYCGTRWQELEYYIVELERALRMAGIRRPGADRESIDFFLARGISLEKRTEKGRIALDDDVLSTIDDPVAELLHLWRKATKHQDFFSRFMEFRSGDRLHTSINPLGAKTGRMSSSRPNLQNVPRSKYVRDAFVPADGNRLLLIDFDQVELRIMAHYAQEEGLLSAVRDGEDLHTYVGRMIYQTEEITPEQRQITKAANFAKIYGAGPEKFGQTAGIDIDEARKFMTTYDARFPGIGDFMGRIISQVRSEGAITTPYLGRKQVAPRDEAYKAVNYFIQGTAADVLKVKLVELAMSDVEQFMVIPIHDEVAFDVPEDLVDDVSMEAQTIMHEPDAFDVPLSVGADIVSRWGEKYE